MDEIKLNDNYIDPQEEMHGAYPYYNTRKSFTTNLLGKFRKTIAPYNPMAYSQVPNQKRQSFALRAGNRFFYSTPYPNTVSISKYMPVHYDPLASADYSKPHWSNETRPPTLIPSIEVETAPRGCARAFDKFKTCENVNGRELCKPELKDIYQICPNFVLEGMKQVQR